MAVKDWFYISKLSGSSGTTILTISASSNTLEEELSSVFSVSTTNKNKNVFVKQQPLEKDYFTIEVISGNANSHLYLSYTNEVIYSYSKNGGDWITHTSGSTGQTDFSLLNSGDIIKVKAVNIHNNYDRNNKMRQIRFSSVNCKFKVKGYLTSLVYGDSFENQTVLPNEIYSGTSSAFQYLFLNCTGLVDASELILPDTLLIGMYYNTFKGCTSLTIAPELTATTLVNRCYYYMFDGSTSLNYIKCLATDLSATDCLTGWTRDVSSSGTFVKASGISWPTGNNGIPTGWTVQEI